LKTRRSPSPDAPWTFAFVKQGWGVGNKIPPEMRRAIAGEMLATRITATSTATVRILIVRFIG
jgi:hypothetical protein